MTKTDLIAQVAANTEMSKKSAEQAVNAVFQARQVPEGHPVIGSVTPPLPAQGAAAFLLKRKE